MPPAAGRTLKTAQAVLRVLRLLEEHPAGLTAEEVAERLGKSAATATYLLNSLRAEGYAERHGPTGTYRAPTARTATGEATATDRHHASLQRLAWLHARTGERAYLATLEGDALVVHASSGRRGQARVPGLHGRVPRAAHATALGKALLAHAPPSAVSRYLTRHGLLAHTRATITDPTTLKATLALIRARGHAVDQEELAAGFCSIAAPLADPLGARAALAVSLPPGRFRARADLLAEEVIEVAQAAAPPASAATTDVPCPPSSDPVRVRWREETAARSSRPKEPT